MKYYANANGQLRLSVLDSNEHKTLEAIFEETDFFEIDVSDTTVTVVDVYMRYDKYHEDLVVSTLNNLVTQLGDKIIEGCIDFTSEEGDGAMWRNDMWRFEYDKSKNDFRELSAEHYFGEGEFVKDAIRVDQIPQKYTELRRAVEDGKLAMTNDIAHIIFAYIEG